MSIIFEEDNAAAIRVIESGKNPTIRHLSRTHKVDLAWLHENFLSKQFIMRYCDTSRQSADIFTKAFPNAQKWRHALQLIAHIRPDLFWRGEDAEKPKEAAAITVSINHHEVKTQIRGVAGTRGVVKTKLFQSLLSLTQRSTPN